MEFEEADWAEVETYGDEARPLVKNGSPWESTFTQDFRYFTSSISDENGNTTTRYEKPFSISSTRAVFDIDDEKRHLKEYTIHFTCLKEYVIIKSPKGFTLRFKKPNPEWLDKELMVSDGKMFMTEGAIA